ncbi:MAG: hypothetical protein HQL50_07860, partial [Magnetococcales bacterium]|nr:hypothetical protein [Magnetococcales bacterium]
LINQKRNISRKLGPSSEIKIDSEGATLISGKLSDPVKAFGNLMEGLQNRFSKTQRYTTIRRGASRKRLTARKITLSQEFPDIVWENIGPGYSYRLIIGEKSIDISQREGDVVRYTVSGLKPGIHPFGVEVRKDDQTVFEASMGKLTWLTNEKMARLQEGIRVLQTAVPGDDFLLAGLLEEHGLMVPAMDHYQKHFSNYPEDNDMRPMLVQAYGKLRLEKLRQLEAKRYFKNLDEE